MKRNALKVIDAYPAEPDNEVTHRPQCEADLDWRLQKKIDQWKKHGRNWYKFVKPGTPDGTCANKARYLINGRWFCRRHAGAMLLDSLAIEQPLSEEG